MSDDPIEAPAPQLLRSKHTSNFLAFLDQFKISVLVTMCQVGKQVDVRFGGDDLWFVNPRFSCLCTLNGIHNFVPRWWPPFVTPVEISSDMEQAK